MVPPWLLDRVALLARDHCAARGYVNGSNWNPLEPQDPVAAFAMARLLVASRQFDHYIAVAPEGHAYGFFFERLGVRVDEVFVDYPPQRVTGTEWLPSVAGGRVLLIEDDVISGLSLRMVIAALETHRPQSISVYLGRRGDSQCLENVPARIEPPLLAESALDPVDRPLHEAEFVCFFGVGCTISGGENRMSADWEIPSRQDEPAGSTITQEPTRGKCQRPACLACGGTPIEIRPTLQYGC